jgi:hypothetical protein
MVRRDEGKVQPAVAKAIADARTMRVSFGFMGRKDAENVRQGYETFVALRD